MAMPLDLAKLRNLTTVNHIDIAIAAVNLFEYVITFELERRRIWGRRLSAVTVIFFVNRYLAVAYSITMILSLGITTEASCHALLLIPCVIFLCLGIVQGVFSSLRIRALWPDRGVLWPVVVFCLYLIPFGTDIWVYSALRPIEPQWFYPCAPQASNTSIVVANRLCVITADIIVLWLTWARTFKNRRELARVGLSPNLPYLLLRDGTVGFLVLLLLNVTQILMASAPPWTDFATVNEFVHWPALYPIVITRFLLSLRQVNDPVDVDEFQGGIDSRLAHISDCNDSEGILGNLGENLHAPFDRVLEDHQPGRVQDDKDSLVLGKSELQTNLELLALDQYAS